MILALGSSVENFRTQSIVEPSEVQYGPTLTILNNWVYSDNRHFIQPLPKRITLL